MIRVSHTDTLGEIGVRSVRIEHRDIIISIIGCDHHESDATGKIWTDMDQVRLYRDNVDITERHPFAYDGELYISGFEDLVKTIKLIDGGYFDKKEVI